MQEWKVQGCLCKTLWWRPVSLYSLGCLSVLTCPGWDFKMACSHCPNCKVELKMLCYSVFQICVIFRNILESKFSINETVKHCRQNSPCMWFSRVVLHPPSFVHKKETFCKMKKSYSCHYKSQTVPQTPAEESTPINITSLPKRIS